MFYTVRHQTRFRYSAPILENVMEVRMQPRTDEFQQCVNFQLHTRPHARISSFHDQLANVVHHFNIPGLHTELTLRAEALVKVEPPPPWPDTLSPDAWQQLDDLPLTHERWEMRSPSHFTAPTAALAGLANELGVARYADPLKVLRTLNTQLNTTFEYAPSATRVDSPIDEAIRQRRGVCQDYAHVMLALVRTYLRIPCRYVSGYLYHRQDDRSAADATHAWIEAWLPELGWVGFDPTNNLIVEDRHIRTAVGRDYRDVPPTRGVFKGVAASELSVSVHVRKADDPGLTEDAGPDGELLRLDAPVAVSPVLASVQQQQQ
jgi:transglutaminase-like putative cysteine protease